MNSQSYEINYLEKWLPEASVKYKDGSPAVNLGLIITVFFKDGHMPEVRRKMVECAERFYTEFRLYLKSTLSNYKWVSLSEKNFAKQRKNILESAPEEIFSWVISSASKSYLAPEYNILIMGSRIFHNESDRSVIKLTFPLSMLNEPSGRENYENWLVWICNTFNVESGYAGISFVLPYARERMFPYEYALAQRFPGVMVDSLGTLEGGGAVIGIKGACWYTMLGQHWLDKLGGRHRVEKSVQNTNGVDVLPYESGIIIKAGELPPALGEVNSEALPSLLVKVNQIIKPIRLNIQRSLHFYSEYEHLQFEEESTRKWYERFDEASALLDVEEGLQLDTSTRYTCWSGDIVIYAGQWAATVNGVTQYFQANAGQRMPEFEDTDGKKHYACWSLVKRDDNGSVFK